MTAVEWLIEEVECRGLVTKELRLAFEQAKEMEKQQIIDAWHNGYNNQSPMIDEENCGQTYYNETYGSKESDHKLTPENGLTI